MKAAISDLQTSITWRIVLVVGIGLGAAKLIFWTRGKERTMSTDQTEQFGRVSSNVDASAPAIIDFSRGGDRAEEFIVRFDAELANVMIKSL